MFTKKDLEGLATPASNVSNTQNAAPAVAETSVKPAALPSELLTPGAQAAVNGMIAAAVKEALAGIAPLLAQSQMTPATLAAAFAEAERQRRLPSEDEVTKKERMLREKKMMKEEIEQNLANTRKAQEDCLHEYVTGAPSISAVNNFPDRQPRFFCHTCMSWFEPRHWIVGELPTRDNPRGTDRIVDAHPLYEIVRKKWTLHHQQA